MPRYFGGWEFDVDLCASPGLIAKSDAQGVPMGADLPSPTGTSDVGAPAFIVSALQDAGTSERPDTALEWIQITQGWVGDAGSFHRSADDVARDPDSGADVDLTTCTPRGQGARSLCSV